jgi:hypothetical protein
MLEADMFVKTYSYRVLPDNVPEMLAIQARTSQAYARQGLIRSTLLRDRQDPNRWLEIQSYADEASFKKGMEVVNADPEIAELWERFQATLGPPDQVIKEMTYEQVWASE